MTRTEEIREKERRARDVVKFETDGLDGCIQLLNCVIGRRQLGVDDGIDEDRPPSRPFVECRLRPATPLPVRRYDIEKNVAVGEDHLRPGSRASSS